MTANAGKRALWVEDSETDQLLLRMASEGTLLATNLDVASDFESGLSMFRDAEAGGTAYALVVIDMRLGLRNGTDLVAIAREESAAPDQEYVVLSGSDDPQDLDRIAAGGAVHVRKPASLEDWRALAARFARSLEEVVDH